MTGPGEEGLQMELAPTSRTPQVMVTVCGRDVMCDILWSEDDGKHMVVRDDKGRELIAKRSLGAWMELTLHTVAARLNRII